MIKNNHHQVAPNEVQQTNFWFGFSLGVSTLLVLSYLLGTRKGREMVRRVLKAAEEIDDNILVLLEKYVEGKGRKIVSEDNPTRVFNQKAANEGRKKEVHLILNKIKGRLK